MEQLQSALAVRFLDIRRATEAIKKELSGHSDTKNLKGDEIVGWLGEIYGKLLLDGRLVEDRLEHDVELANGDRISVKTRKGRGSGWNQTSAIPKIEGDGSPTDLLFVHLNDDYTLDRMWRFPWSDLVKANRFKPHMVRGSRRSYVIRVHEKNDERYLIYPDKT